jgi:hypothetical protein
MSAKMQSRGGVSEKPLILKCAFDQAAEIRFSPFDQPGGGIYVEVVTSQADVDLSPDAEAQLLDWLLSRRTARSMQVSA